MKNRMVMFLILILALLIAVSFNLKNSFPAKTVSVSSNNFKSDFNIIYDKLNLPDSIAIDEFQVLFNRNGDIERFSYSLIDYNSSFEYRVTYKTLSQRYKVKRVKLDMQGNESNLLEAKKFFSALNKINIIDIVDLGKYVSISGDYENNLTPQGKPTYLFKENEFIRVEGKVQFDRVYMLVVIEDNYIKQKYVLYVKT